MLDERTTQLTDLAILAPWIAHPACISPMQVTQMKHQIQVAEFSIQLPERRLQQEDCFFS